MRSVGRACAELRDRSTSGRRGALRDRWGARGGGSGRIGLVAAWIALVTTPLRALAAGEDPVTADALFREAKTRMAEGDVARACTLFAESQRLDPAAGTLLNLADCEEKNGRFATAHQLFVRASETLPPSDERIGYATERAKALEPRLSSVVLRLAPNAPSNLRVVKDGTTWSAASFGVPVPLDPGEYVLDVQADGRAPHRMPISLAPGEKKSVDVVWGEPLAPAWPTVSPEAGKDGGEVPAPPKTSSGRSTIGYVVGGVGVGAFVAGAVTGALVIGYANTYNDHCKPACDDEGLRAARQGKPLNVLSPILLGLGAVGVGVGVYLILSDEPRGPRTTVRMTPNGAFVTTTF